MQEQYFYGGWCGIVRSFPPSCLPPLPMRPPGDTCSPSQTGSRSDGAVIADPVRRVCVVAGYSTTQPSTRSPVELDTATGWTLFSRLNDASGSFRPLRGCPGHDPQFPAHLCFAGSHRDLSQPPHAHIPAVPESSNAHAVEVLPVTSPARGWLPLVMPLQPTGFLPVHSWLLRWPDAIPA